MILNMQQLDKSNLKFCTPPKPLYKFEDLDDDCMTAVHSPHKWSEAPLHIRHACVDFLNGKCSLYDCLDRCFEGTPFENANRRQQIQLLRNRHSICISCEYEMIVHNGLDIMFDSMGELLDALGMETNAERVQTTKDIELYCYMDEKGVSCWSGGRNDYNICVNGTIYHGTNLRDLCEHVGLGTRYFRTYDHFDDMGVSFRRFWNIVCEEPGKPSDAFYPREEQAPRNTKKVKKKYYTPHPKIGRPRLNGWQVAIRNAHRKYLERAKELEAMEKYAMKPQGRPRKRKEITK